MEVQSAPVFGGLPAGVVVPYAGTTAPAGWLLCFGQLVSRTTYPALHAVIAAAGYPYPGGAGDGSTTFGLPDCRDVTIVGKGDMGGANRGLIAGTDPKSVAHLILGAAGGEELHAPTTNETFQHQHDSRDSALGNGRSNATGFGSSALAFASQTGTVVNPQTSLFGNSFVHNNMQPSTILNYIIATGGP